MVDAVLTMTNGFLNGNGIAGSHDIFVESNCGQVGCCWQDKVPRLPPPYPAGLRVARQPARAVNLASSGSTTASGTNSFKRPAAPFRANWATCLMRLLEMWV